MENEEILKREKILRTALKLAVRDLNIFVKMNTENKGIPYYIEDYIQEAELFLKDKEEEKEQDNESNYKFRFNWIYKEI